MQQAHERPVRRAAFSRVRARHPVRADFIAFAGLGAFDSFTPQTLEAVGENLARMFIATRVDDFATVPIGGASGGYSVEALQSFLAGLVRGILDADGNQTFRRVTICEIDDQRYSQLRDALYQLARTQLFEKVEVTLQELPQPKTQINLSRGGIVPRGSAGELVLPLYGTAVLEARSAVLSEDRQIGQTTSCTAIRTFY